MKSDAIAHNIEKLVNELIEKELPSEEFNFHVTYVPSSWSPWRITGHKKPTKISESHIQLFQAQFGGSGKTLFEAVIKTRKMLDSGECW